MLPSWGFTVEPESNHHNQTISGFSNTDEPIQMLSRNGTLEALINIDLKKEKKKYN